MCCLAHSGTRCGRCPGEGGEGEEEGQSEREGRSSSVEQQPQLLGLYKFVWEPWQNSQGGSGLGQSKMPTNRLNWRPTLINYMSRHIQDCLLSRDFFVCSHLKPYFARTIFFWSEFLNFVCSHFKSRAKKNELLHFASLRSAICLDLVENGEEILKGFSFLAKQHRSFSQKKIWFWWFPVVLLEDYLTCLLQEWQREADYEIGRRIMCWHLQAGNLKEKTSTWRSVYQRNVFILAGRGIRPPILLRYCLIYNLIPSFLSDGPACLRIWILGRT